MTYELDGERFSTLEEFYAEFSRTVVPDRSMGSNFDAFEEVLRGGIFTLTWKNVALSRERLGYPETVRQLEKRLVRADPSNYAHIEKELAAARAHHGPTAFDWIEKRLAGEPGIEVLWG